MPAVVFAFGGRPSVARHDALEIAELLGRTRNLAAKSAASKIGGQARRDAGELRQDVHLNGAEMIELFAYLSSPPTTRLSEAVANLQHELRNALSATDN